MAFKILAGLIALVLLIAYLGAPIVKLKDLPLAIVALIGIAMAIVDLWQSLQSKED
jgi:hypothetical protein